MLKDLIYERADAGPEGREHQPAQAAPTWDRFSRNTASVINAARRKSTLVRPETGRQKPAWTASAKPFTGRAQDPPKDGPGRPASSPARRKST